MFESIKRDFTNVWRRPNSGLQKIIIVNVIIFAFINLMRLFIRDQGSYDFFFNFFAIPVQFNEWIFRPWTIITNFYTHEGFFHILFNMLWLYHFGKILDGFLGSDKLVAVYILGGIVGTFAVLIYYTLDPINTSLLGASGAVLAVGGATATLSPDYRINLLFFGNVKIKYVFLALMLLSLFAINGNNRGGQIAHLGGGALGWFYIIQLRKGTNIGQWVISVIDGVQNIFKPKKIKVTYRRPKSSSTSRGPKSSGSTTRKTESKTPQAEIDAILDKINESGYDSLSKEEKQKLFNAGD